jgi:tRNA/tmRNA/rRNA uracil-C5-methylase (TrmA/RlmC/RlmD family)
MDYDRATLSFASKNLAGCGAKFRFFAARIDGQNVTDAVSVKTMTDVVHDPPRKGTGRGVIESLAAMNVRRVLHVFCGVDTLADELSRWKKAGYVPRRIVPLDMFAGCAALEVMVLLERKG